MILSYYSKQAPLFKGEEIETISAIKERIQFDLWLDLEIGAKCPFG